MREPSRESDFFSVPRHLVRVSAGDVELPILYTEASATTVFYSVSREAARSVLRPHGLAPAEVAFRGAVCAITWFEYRQTSIGAYNEVGISLLAAPGLRPPVLPLVRLMARDPRLGFFVVHLPVTTEIARSGGVDIYGFPKTVCEIPLRFSPTEIEGAIVDGGHEVLSMRIPLSRGLGVPMIDLVTYSTREGRLLRTVVPTRCRAELSRAPSVALALGSAEHPIARTLRELELSRRPLAVLHVPEFRSRLPLPQLLD